VKTVVIPKRGRVERGGHRGVVGGEKVKRVVETKG